MLESTTAIITTWSYICPVCGKTIKNNETHAHYYNEFIFKSKEDQILDELKEIKTLLQQLVNRSY